jgi:putative transposase
LLDVDRSSLYNKPLGESKGNLVLMLRIDELLLSEYAFGDLGIQDELKDLGLVFNVKRIRHLMRKATLDPIFPKRNISGIGVAGYIRPYLLRGVEVTRSNEVWAIDITYIPIKSGFMYLAAIIAVCSRFIVDWQISTSVVKETQTMVLQFIIQRFGKIAIVNLDKLSLYTCELWGSSLLDCDIRITMNRKRRPIDNAFIERFFGTLKIKHIYFNSDVNGRKLSILSGRLSRETDSSKLSGNRLKKSINVYLKVA